MQCGGYWDLMPRGFVDVQIERQIADGIDRDAARRFAHALAFGGCSEAEAWDIIAERDCRRFGTGLDLIDIGDLPDRWFRDAWRRSPNGGPIRVDLDAARNIQWWRLQAAGERLARHRARSIDGIPFEIDWSDVRARIKSVQNEHELKRIWPEELSDNGARG